jgi:thiol-disulfide isomerase/thioredoxin
MNIQTLFSNFNWKIGLLVLLLVVLLVVFGIYTFRQTQTHNKEEYTSSSSSNDVANLMLFYVDWCPHCKTAKPEWDSLKQQYEGQNINGYTMVFTEYNCTNDSPEVEELMNKYKIEGYPTIKLMKNNQVIEYDAKPTKSTLIEFLNTVL